MSAASPIPSPAPFLRVSASSPSVPSIVAHAKTSPVLRAQHPADDDDDGMSVKKNDAGLFTLPPPLATTQALFTSPAGPRGAPTRSVPPLMRAASTMALRGDEPLSYNRVSIQYAEHVASKEMTDTANLVRQALQLRRHFVYRSPQRPTTEFDVRVNPAFQHPSEELPPATKHGYMVVDGVFVAWEGEQSQPPPITEFFSHAITSPSTPHSAKLRGPHSQSPTSAGAAAFYTCPSRSDYALALSLLMDISSSGPLRSFCHNRLGLLEMRFSLHGTLNGELEAVAQRAVPHRDFYNVRKIDGHVHHSAVRRPLHPLSSPPLCFVLPSLRAVSLPAAAAQCMNQKHLLRFIKYKLKVRRSLHPCAPLSLPLLCTAHRRVWRCFPLGRTTVTRV